MNATQAWGQYEAIRQEWARQGFSATLEQQLARARSQWLAALRGSL